MARSLAVLPQLQHMDASHADMWHAFDGPGSLPVAAQEVLAAGDAPPAEAGAGGPGAHVAHAPALLQQAQQEPVPHGEPWFQSLQALELSDCMKLEYTSLPKRLLAQLTRLNLSDCGCHTLLACQVLFSLPDFPACTRIASGFRNCWQLGLQCMPTLLHHMPASSDASLCLQIVQNASSVQELDLSSNNTFTTDIWQTLHRSALPALTSLSLVLNRHVFDHAQRQVFQPPPPQTTDPEDLYTPKSAKMLHDPAAPLLFSMAERSLASLTSLEHLDLAGTDIGDSGAAAVAALTRLTSLGLLDCHRLSAASLVSIARLPSLQRLALSFVNLRSQTAPLARCQALTQLSLISCNMRDEDAHFARALPRLRSLTACNSDIVPHDVAADDFRNCFGVGLWQHLQMCQALRRVTAALDGECALDEHAAWLVRFTHLEVVVVASAWADLQAHVADLACLYRQVWSEAQGHVAPITFGTLFYKP
jgi:Leucine Rich repeat